MDIKEGIQKLWSWVGKFKYPLLILALGLVLMTLPVSKKTEAPEPSNAQTQEKMDLAGQIQQVLNQIDGVGRVRVLLTQATGERYEYQYNQDTTVSEGSSSNRQDMVIITDSDRNQSPILSQILPPKYLGAVIVCQGADSPAVKLAVVEAVSKLTGLGADAICVVKMK